MINYDSTQHLSARERRSVRIDRVLFEELVGVLAKAESLKTKRGWPSNQLCLALSYWREYRTLFHLGLSFGVHESNAQRIRGTGGNTMSGGSGYQGLALAGCTVIWPFKKPKRRALESEEKAFNQPPSSGTGSDRTPYSQFKDLSDSHGRLSRAPTALWAPLEPYCWTGQSLNTEFFTTFAWGLLTL
jgi:hypothetical protein